MKLMHNSLIQYDREMVHDRAAMGQRPRKCAAANSLAGSTINISETLCLGKQELPEAKR
jgi:hypothetical protein